MDLKRYRHNILVVAIVSICTSFIPLISADLSRLYEVIVPFILSASLSICFEPLNHWV